MDTIGRFLARSCRDPRTRPDGAEPSQEAVLICYGVGTLGCRAVGDYPFRDFKR